MANRKIRHVFVDGIESKRCSRCESVLPIDKFYRSKITSDHLRSACRICEHKENAAAYSKDSAHAKKRLKQWAADNPDKMKKAERKRWLSDYRKASTRAWRERNPEKTKEYAKRQWARTKQDADRMARCITARRDTYTRRMATARGRLEHRMSTALRIALSGGKSYRKWTSLVGYTVYELIERLNETMPEGYSWEQIGELHIDHVIPKSLFQYESVDDEKFKECWALENLQLLPALDNIKKSNKIL